LFFALCSRAALALGLLLFFLGLFWFVYFILNYGFYQFFGGGLVSDG
jgi:hypothetical protein